MRYGASPQDWAHFDVVLGLADDLLPVVSNPNAIISPHSTLKGLGKTPSRYNGHAQVVGIPDWTSHHTNPKMITNWAKEADYGICIQTRLVRALDVDVVDPKRSSAIADRIAGHLGPIPTRTRNDSGKCLLAFMLRGDFTKRKFAVDGGVVEFLATGQQFVAVGQHPDGARYEWQDGLPDEIPEITPEQFEAVWQDLVDTFAVEAPSERASSVKKQKLSDVVANDPRAQFLIDNDWVVKMERDGRLHIRCPFEEDHTGDSSESATTYWPAHTGGYVHGHYLCMHAHCEHRKDADFDEAIGYQDRDALSEFEDISRQDLPEPPRDDGKYTSKFAPIPAGEYAVLQPTEWLIKGVLPHAELAVVYGESTSGKTFAVLDLGFAVARGCEWRGRTSKQGRVVYIAAEGAAGLRKRLLAYGEHTGIDLANMPLDVIPAAPNLLQHKEALELAKVIKATGGAQLIIVDTFAQATAGGNENSGEDVGQALAHCRGLHRATGALVLLVHHSGKDTSKGARGWSGLRAAADAEMEVTRYGHDRALTVSKQKDGDDGETFNFKLVTVALGEDADGEPITSCVVSGLESGATPRARQRVKLGTVESTVMRVLDQLQSLGEDDGLREVDVRQAAVDQMVEPEEGKRDRRAYKVDRALDTLLAHGFLEKKNGLLVKPT